MPAILRGQPRRVPWPFDLDLDGNGYMLGAPEEGGELIIIRPPLAGEAAPQDFSFTAQNPAIEQSFMYSDLSAGFGLRYQKTENDRRYFYASGIDASIGGSLTPGPVLNHLTPTTVDSTNGITHFFEIDGSLYALNGRYVLVRAEVQTITQSGGAGTFTVTFSGNTTAAQAWNVSAANLQTALRGLAGLESVTVTLSGLVYTIVMRGAGNNPAQMTTGDAGGSSTVVATSATSDQNGSWVVDKDFGSGKVALDVVVHKQNTASSTAYAYIALGDTTNDFIYRFDGTTYTQHASLYARAFCLVGRELWRFHDTNKASKVDTNSDPWTAANWTAANSFYIGDSSSAVTRATVTSAGTMLIFKTDGVYVLDPDGNDIQLYSDLKLAPDASNGKYYFKYENWIHLTLTGRHFRIDPSLSIEPIGPERYVENDSIISGYITAGAGTPFCAYAGIYNPDTDTSYLMKFGGYPATIDGDPERIDAWHGALNNYVFDNDYLNMKITAMYRTTTGQSSTHERLYIGTSTGMVSYFVLPCKPNPVACSSYRFKTDSGVITGNASAEYGLLVTPIWSGPYPSESKVIRTLVLSGRNMATDDAGIIPYRNESTSMYDPITVVNAGYASFSSNGITSVDVNLTDVSFSTLALALLNHNGNGTDAPLIVRSFGFTYTLRPSLKLVYEFLILADEQMVRRDGTRYAVSAPLVRSRIRALVAQVGYATAVFASEEGKSLLLTDYQESTAWDDRTKQWRAAIKVRAVELLTNTEFYAAAKVVP